MKKIIAAIAIVVFLSSPASALTLQESIDIAVKKNPTVISAAEKAKAANAKLAQAWGGFFPKLSVDASLGRSYTEPMQMEMAIPGVTPESITTTPDEAANISSLTLSLKQSLFTGGRLTSGLSVADAGSKIAEEDLRKAKNDVVCNTTINYFNVIKTQKLLELAREQLDNLKKHTDLVDLYYRSDFGTKADVLRAQTELANAKQFEIISRNNLKLAKIAFNSTIAADLSDEVIASSEGFGIEQKPVELRSLIASAYEKRPEWISFKLGKKIAEDGVTLAASGIYPDISLVGSGGKSITDYPKSETKYDLDSWKAIISGTWTLFDGLANFNKVSEAQASFDAIKAQEQSMKDAIALEVSSAYFELESANERVIAASSALDLAKKSLNLSELSFQAHIGTSLAVLDAEAALLKAENDLWNAKFDVEIAKAKLTKAVGVKIF